MKTDRLRLLCGFVVVVWSACLPDRPAPIDSDAATPDAPPGTPDADVSIPDALPDAIGCTGDCLAPGVPGLLMPWNGTTTGSARAASSLRPWWTFTRAAGDVTHYEVELDASCAFPIGAACAFTSPTRETFVATGEPVERHHLAVALEVETTTPPLGRRYYWRLRACNGPECSAWTATRYLDVGRLSSDVNGDGYGDVVVSAAEVSGGLAGEGGVFVFHGQPGGSLVYARTLAAADSQASLYFGEGVSVGDMTGDGFADVLVGTGRFDASGNSAVGEAYLYRGSATGIASAYDRRYAPPTPDENSYFGRTVQIVGDLDADGFGDAIISSPGRAGHGVVYLLPGASPVPPDAVSVFRENPDNDGQGPSFGLALTSGDFNADGRLDLAIGAPFSGTMQPGKVAVYLGTGTAAGGGIAASATPVVMSQPRAQSYFGHTLAAGDLDGDGDSELLVGAQYASLPTTGEGIVVLFRGAPTGFGATSTTLESPGAAAQGRFGSSVCAADVDGDGIDDVLVGAAGEGAGVTRWIRGPWTAASVPPLVPLTAPTSETGAQFGNAASLIADIDGDGRRDALVVAPKADATVVDEGKLYAFRSGTGGLSATVTSTVDAPAPVTGGELGYAVAHE